MSLRPLSVTPRPISAVRSSQTLTTRAYAASSFAVPSGPTPIVAPSGGGDGWLQDLGRAAIDIGTDYVRSKLIPGNTNTPNPGTTVPGPLTNTPVPQTCPDGTVSILGQCINMPGGSVTGGGAVLSYGEAVMGRYGAGMVPAAVAQTTRRCPRGAVLANDGLCYNRKDLAKRDRMWVPGRKPLLTGGDLNAISRASRAANKMKAQQKRLQAMGLLPKPTRGRRGAAPRAGHRLALPAGVTVIDTD